MTSSEETYICKKIIKIPVILFLNRHAEEEEEEKDVLLRCIYVYIPISKHRNYTENLMIRS